MKEKLKLALDLVLEAIYPAAILAVTAIINWVVKKLGLVSDPGSTVIVVAGSIASIISYIYVLWDQFRRLHLVRQTDYSILQKNALKAIEATSESSEALRAAFDAPNKKHQSDSEAISEDRAEANRYIENKNINEFKPGADKSSDQLVKTADSIIKIADKMANSLGIEVGIQHSVLREALLLFHRDANNKILPSTEISKKSEWAAAALVYWIVRLRPFDIPEPSEDGNRFFTEMIAVSVGLEVARVPLIERKLAEQTILDLSQALRYGDVTIDGLFHYFAQMKYFPKQI